MALGLYSPPPKWDMDSRGKLWPRSGMTKYGPNGEPCWDHCGWLNGPDMSPVWFGDNSDPVKPHPATPPPASPVRPVTLRGLGGAPVVVWDDETTACSMPTAMGFLLFGSVGAYAARRGKAAQGAMNGVWGSWLGCAAASAIGIRPGPLATALTVAGAYYAARIS